jgi:hypothetical protein
MYILRIEHPVPDYDAWKASFESDPIGRERSGVRCYRALRATDDPNYVMIDLEFDTAGEAVKAALGNVELDGASEAEAALPPSKPLCSAPTPVVSFALHRAERSQQPTSFSASL